MHKIEDTPKIITIIGLVLEGLAGLVYTGMAVLFSYSGGIIEFLQEADEMTVEEEEFLQIMMNWMSGLFIVLAILFVVMFFINLYLFTKLIRGSYTDAQAKKVYLYQAIWGGINVLLNTVTGILYLVSGIQGYSGQVDRINTREGI